MGSVVIETSLLHWRAKPKPKCQSKKDKSLKWTGRLILPTWMREEMKGTKLTKKRFLIK